ncbi:MAG: hypothetical protein ABDH25_01155, partial [Dictyoglomaceae bacterium]
MIKLINRKSQDINKISPKIAHRKLGASLGIKMNAIKQIPNKIKLIIKISCHLLLKVYYFF